jgi:hypothetical protein
MKWMFVRLLDITLQFLYPPICSHSPPTLARTFLFFCQCVHGADFIATQILVEVGKTNPDAVFGLSNKATEMRLCTKTQISNFLPQKMQRQPNCNQENYQGLNAWV